MIENECLIKRKSMENIKTTTEKVATIDEEAKKIAIISYITIIGLVIAYVMNNERKKAFASYHIRQSLGLGLTSLALSIVGIIPFVGWLISISGIFVITYMWIVGLMNAINEKEAPVPFLGARYEKWFEGL